MSHFNESIVEEAALTRWNTNGPTAPSKLNQGNMNRIEFMLPSADILRAFEKKIEPLFAQIRANSEQSRTLATLRDTLLPRLLSGEQQVKSDVSFSS